MGFFDQPKKRLISRTILIILSWLKFSELGVFHIGKRIGYFVHWEPIYIGTHDDPHYDERLSWEGKSDKMTQVCCLFFFHPPGNKHTKHFQFLVFFFRVMHCVHLTTNFKYWIMHFWSTNQESKCSKKIQNVPCLQLKPIN